MQNMQHEKSFDKQIELDRLENIKISNDRTYHHIDNIPLYKAKFLNVEKFHKPGLAPVYDQKGGYHIDLSGKPIYLERFQKVFGFYCNRAAVMNEDAYFHIDATGNRFYQNSYEWVGNYQENKCVVKKDNKFFHIDIVGNEIYPNKYDYVGDFKDDIAVVHVKGRATHITNLGELLHSKWYKYLHIYHKGYAVAEDENGRFHIDILGNPVYTKRFKTVEPFYNGLAMVEDFDGYIGQIDITAQIIHIVHAPAKNVKMHEISKEFVGFWPAYLINAAIELKLLELLPNKISVLSKDLKIEEQNLLRLLRALWEIGLITYDETEKIWQLDTKGRFLLNNSFMLKAAKMWARVIREENWLKIPELLKKTFINSFPTFKEQEPSQELRTEYYQALLGYTKIDIENFANQIKIDADKKILLVGIHSGALIPILKNMSIKTIDFYNKPQLPMQVTSNFNVRILDAEPNAQYDTAIIARYFQNMDDFKVMEYLKLLQKLNLPQILLIETILDKNKPTGGMVDINIMVESGGKIRTEKEWQLLLGSCCKYLQIENIIPLTGYLSIIDIKNTNI